MSNPPSPRPCIGTHTRTHTHTPRTRPQPATNAPVACCSYAAIREVDVLLGKGAAGGSGGGGGGSAGNIGVGGDDHGKAKRARKA